MKCYIWLHIVCGHVFMMLGVVSLTNMDCNSQFINFFLWSVSISSGVMFQAHYVSFFFVLFFASLNQSVGFADIDLPTVCSWAFIYHPCCLVHRPVFFGMYLYHYTPNCGVGLQRQVDILFKHHAERFRNFLYIWDDLLLTFISLFLSLFSFLLWPLLIFDSYRWIEETRYGQCLLNMLFMSFLIFIFCDYVATPI